MNVVTKLTLVVMLFFSVKIDAEQITLDMRNFETAHSVVGALASGEFSADIITEIDFIECLPTFKNEWLPVIVAYLLQEPRPFPNVKIEEGVSFDFQDSLADKEYVNLALLEAIARNMSFLEEENDETMA
jgi:hypothetical protein